MLIIERFNMIFKSIKTLNKFIIHCSEREKWLEAIRKLKNPQSIKYKYPILSKGWDYFVVTNAMIARLHVLYSLNDTKIYLNNQTMANIAKIINEFDTNYRAHLAILFPVMLETNLKENKNSKDFAADRYIFNSMNYRGLTAIPSAFIGYISMTDNTNAINITIWILNVKGIGQDFNKLQMYIILLNTIPISIKIDRQILNKYPKI